MHSPSEFNAHNICLFRQFVFTCFSLFHRPTHWMGRRIYFRGCAMLYQVSFNTFPSPQERTWIQINSKHVVMIAACLFINWYLFITGFITLNERLAHIPEKVLCIWSKHCMAINLEPLLLVSVLEKPIAKVNDYAETLCKY